MSIKGLEQAIANLNSISKTAVPRASSQAVNRIAVRAIGRSSTVVSRETRVQRKLVMQRSKLKKASVKNPVATLRVNRGDLPAIKLGAARVQLSRRAGRVRGENSVLKIGRYSFPHAFIQRLANGRWHVLQRTGKARYPVEVVKIPMSVPLTTAFRDQLPKLMESDMPREMASALKNQLRIIIKR
ncbi:tail protein [Erwinia typographi]|uniref:Tail protein n=1 Tax=Erwinia typographi TaxID=371042 RepID=A0A0A3ZNC3_9GAMM|nr:phage tail protein [Erwinia typographi]KGT87238.1 tail protein [Erwinia typographi]